MVPIAPNLLVLVVLLNGGEAPAVWAGCGVMEQVVPKGWIGRQRVARVGVVDKCVALSIGRCLEPGSYMGHKVEAELTAQPSEAPREARIEAVALRVPAHHAVRDGLPIPK